MANGRNKKGNSGRDPGGFIALPWSVMDCSAYQRLTVHARALLLEVARQYVRDNNGRLLLSRDYMAKRGWKSNDMLTKAKRELLDGGFLHQTVMGHRPNKASWYAITWQPLDRHPGYDPGAVETFERGAYRANVPIKNAVLRPSHGTGGVPIAPSHGTEKQPPVPPHGAMKEIFGGSSVPPHGHLLEMPSDGVLKRLPSSAVSADASPVEAAKAIDTLASLWAAVGCRSVWTKPTDAERARLHQIAIDRAAKASKTSSERMKAARDAEAQAKARHVRNGPPVACAVAGAVHVEYDGVSRERDEHAHDMSAWAD